MMRVMEQRGIKLPDLNVDVPHEKPNYHPAFVSYGKPFINRYDLADLAKALLVDNDLRCFIIRGERDTGKSHLFHYFWHLKKTLKFKLHLIDLNALAATNPVVDAERVAREINRYIHADFSFNTVHNPEDVFKTDEYCNAVLAKLGTSKALTVLYFDGIGAASPTRDALGLIERLMNLCEDAKLNEDRPDNLRLILVDYVHLQESWQIFETKDFTAKDVIKWFDLAEQEHKSHNPHIEWDLQQKLKSIAYVLEMGGIEKSPNVERIAKLAIEMYWRLTQQ